ncbi:helix-turn-helix transcriptional regulator [Elstera litoralis]|uniref:helix-turn-helix transcriptional regulator n=1 Tax=Elstera litoralis TaxID=552518 RepID=UPI0018DB29B4|nr:WYL domain-containing protein [Elstera litoralis]
MRDSLAPRTLHAWGSVAPEGLDLGLVRAAIRAEEKLSLDYRDEQGRATQRIIQPIALIYYSETATIVGWCELRHALRNFRADRVAECQPTGTYFQGEGDRLRSLWMEGWSRAASP